MIAIVIAATPALADDTIAGTAYGQAIALENAGKWAEACPLYEASYRADPQIGVLLHLAICHEQIGHIASAWSEFNDAADLAHARKDPRESTARDRANALAPRLAKLYLAAPSKPIPGFVVRRDGVDITALVGTNMPIDPGDHEIVASAPGYLDWKTTVKITGPTAAPTTVDLPLLQKAPDAPIKLHEGTIKITTQADAEILLDTKHVGVGHYEAKVRSGGHTLRVVAPGVHPYQSEIVVGDDEERAIDVPLDREVVELPEVHEDLPGFELGASFAPGKKEHGDDPTIVSYRLELAKRFGRRVNFGVFAGYESVSAAGSCGTNVPGATPSGQFDFEARTHFIRCQYALLGLQLYFHLRPKQQIDPYFGFAPGVRLGTFDYSTYDAAGGTMTGMTQSQFWPGIELGVRVGVDYHPMHDMPGWQVGVFVEGQVYVIAQEDFSNTNNSGPSHFLTVFSGLRSTFQF